ncbi:MAG TPA: CmpA/NrtA family ABC transporter substrate-binding protein [Bryobacteraceae bacterium]|nr:CmpA/NrtA family ABC transporter substrate-binding protein [Bryobacteraceae bacterium]
MLRRIDQEGAEQAPVLDKSRKTPSPPRKSCLRVGFVPLMDAAPLLAAHELGYFRDEGIEVALDRQIGWGNIRDKLTFGRLHAAHALIGMPLFSQLSREWFSEPLIAVMNLGSGGNAITISRRLADAGVHSAQTLAEFIRRDPRQEVLAFAHVFGCSMHHYLLRDWLSAAGIDPDGDIRLRIIPPPQMSQHMAQRHLDGFCAGEPWNTLAERDHVGKVIALTTDIIPDHPEKTLVVTRRWAQQNGPAISGLIRALLRACEFCDDSANNSRLTEILARPEYIDAPGEVISASLNLESALIAGGVHRAHRPRDWRFRSFSQGATFPSATHSAWLLREMIRWRHVAPSIGERGTEIALRCVDSTAYRAAAESMQIACPPTDLPPMQLRNRIFDPAGEPALATEGATDVTRV